MATRTSDIPAARLNTHYQADIDPGVRRLHAVVERVLNRVARTAARNFRRKATSHLTAAGDWNPPDPDELVNVQQIVQQMRTKMDPIRQALIRERMNQALHEAGLKWDPTNPFVVGVLDRTGSKITQIADTTQVNVMRIVKDSYEQGLSIPDTAKAIQQGMQAASKARATLIARTEMTSIASGGSLAATRIVAQATGDTYYKRWLCVPPWTRVAAAGVVAAVKKPYEGDLVVVTARASRDACGSGPALREFSVTPDHLVLTRRGWIPAGFLDEFDEVVGHGFAEWDCASDPDVDDIQPCVEQIFDAAADRLAAVGMVSTPVYLNGGRLGEKVDVVSPDGVLGDGLDIAVSEPLREFMLAVSDVRLDELLSGGAHSDRILAHRDSQPCGVSEFPFSEQLVGVAPVAEPVCLPFGSEPHSSFEENNLDGVVSGAKHRPELLHGDATLVEFNQVVNVERRPFAGHVYDLTTHSGWFLADGYVAHNTAPGAEHPRHEDYDGLDGQTVALDDLFQVGDAQLSYPGDFDGPPDEVCNCRCSLIYVNTPDEDVSSTSSPPGAEPDFQSSVGITPFRAGEDNVIGFYETKKFTQFFNDARKAADHYGVSLDGSTRAEGLWQGETEPSVQLQVHDGKIGVRAFAADLGKAYNQDGVLLFSPHTPDAPVDIQATFAPGADREKMLAALNLQGIDGGTFLPDGSLQVIGQGSDFVGKVERVSSLTGSQYEAHVGTMDLLLRDEGHYEKAIQATTRAGHEAPLLPPNPVEMANTYKAEQDKVIGNFLVKGLEDTMPGGTSFGNILSYDNYSGRQSAKEEIERTLAARLSTNPDWNASIATDSNSFVLPAEHPFTDAKIGDEFHYDNNGNWSKGPGAYEYDTWKIVREAESNGKWTLERGDGAKTYEIAKDYRLRESNAFWPYDPNVTTGAIGRQRVAGLVSQWAGTSADDTPWALAVQKAIADEFGLEEPVWLEGRSGWSEGERIYAQAGPALRAFVRAMYDETQEQLKSAGIDHVMLYRGQGLYGDQVEALLKTGEAGVVEEPVALQPASSFSSDYAIARSFGRTPPAMIAAKVPAERILGSCRTGFGCLSEQEFVVLAAPQGVEDDALVWASKAGDGYYSIPQQDEFWAQAQEAAQNAGTLTHETPVASVTEAKAAQFVSAPEQEQTYKAVQMKQGWMVKVGDGIYVKQDDGSLSWIGGGPGDASIPASADVTVTYIGEDTSYAQLPNNVPVGTKITLSNPAYSESKFAPIYQVVSNTADSTKLKLIDPGAITDLSAEEVASPFSLFYIHPVEIGQLGLNIAVDGKDLQAGDWIVSKGVPFEIHVPFPALEDSKWAYGPGGNDQFHIDPGGKYEKTEKPTTTNPIAQFQSVMTYGSDIKDGDKILVNGIPHPLTYEDGSYSFTGPTGVAAKVDGDTLYPVVQPTPGETITTVGADLKPGDTVLIHGQWWDLDSEGDTLWAYSPDGQQVKIHSDTEYQRVPKPT